MTDFDGITMIRTLNDFNCNSDLVSGQIQCSLDGGKKFHRQMAHL